VPLADDLWRLGGAVRSAVDQGPACQRRFFDYQIVRQVPLTAERTTWVTLVEVWDRPKPGRGGSHNSFVTDFELDPENVSVGVAIGRSNWKIENERFNVHKNHGDELEHNYGHGRQSFSLVFYLLNLLAFAAPALLERGDRLYQQARAPQSRREVWTGLLTLMNRERVRSWAELLRCSLADAVPSP
jgi:hypothetical protein